MVTFHQSVYVRHAIFEESLQNLDFEIYFLLQYTVNLLQNQHPYHLKNYLNMNPLILSFVH